MTELGRAALNALGADRWHIADARKHVEPVPGLYAIHGAEATWIELGLEYRSQVPLYVGMSESSLVARDLGQHFALNPELPARTGGSTVRRSFAALLRDSLQLRGVPRNKENPGHFANYGLEPTADLALTRWMHERLTLSVWSMPVELRLRELEDVETYVIRSWKPPLNIRRNPGRLKKLSVARAKMAADARAWTADEG